MKLWPVFVPSKGRHFNANLRSVYGALLPTIVVEPQDERSYRVAFPSFQLLVLPVNNGGIAFVRNFILERARILGFEWFWMIDDDITSFSTQVEGKNVKQPAEVVLLAAQKIIDRPEVAQGALEYQQFSWAAKKECVESGYCDVCVAIHAKRSAPIRYRPEVALKEDRDFTIQLMARGSKVIRCSRLGFAAPKNGSNKGGLSEIYAKQGREAQASAALAAKWPDFVKVNTKSDGRVDAKIDWQALKALRISE